MKKASERVDAFIISSNSDLAGAPKHVKSLVESRMPFDILTIFGAHGEIEVTLRSQGHKTMVLPTLRNNFNLLQDLFSFFSLSLAVIKHRPKLIHAHSAKAALISRLVGFSLRVPVIYTVHGWPWREFKGLKRALIIATEKIMGAIWTHTYIFVSSSVLEDWRRDLGAGSSDFHVIPNGVERIPTKSEKFGGAIKILMLARVCPAKDHATLLSAFEKLPYRAQLCLAGGGTEDNLFKKQAKSLCPKSFSDIKFLGAIDDVQSLLSECNIVVLTSHFEAMPLSVLEAMAATRAVIATDVGGVAEVISNGVNGLLVKPGSIDQLATAITALCDEKYRGDIARAGFKTFNERYSLERMVKAVQAVYAERI